MQRITREQARRYAFDWRDEPLLQVQPGESFEVETYDASTGYFKTEADLAMPAKRPGFDRSPPLANPIGGPVYVEGAERGDTLVMTIDFQGQPLTITYMGTLADNQINGTADFGGMAQGSFSAKKKDAAK